MANKIKYTTNADAGTIKKGNWSISTRKHGSSIAGYWNGIEPLEGGYTIYTPKASGGPAIFVADNDQMLLSYIDTLGPTFTTVTEALAWALTQDDIIIMDSRGVDEFSTNGLFAYFDAALPFSSARDNTTAWEQISHNSPVANPEGRLNSGVTWNPEFGGYYNANGSHDFEIYHGQPNTWTTDPYTIEIWFRLNALPASQYDANTPIYGNRIGSDYMIFAHPAVNGKSKLAVSYDDSRYHANHMSTYEVEAGEWVQFVHIGRPYNDGTYNRGTLEYWINGKQDRSEFISSDGNGYSISNVFEIGWDLRWGPKSNIDVAIIKHYNRALDPAEIQQNYKAHQYRFEQNGEWNKFWWYDGEILGEWPHNKTDVLQHSYGEIPEGAFYGFQKLPESVQKINTELLAKDGDGNIYKWDFNHSSNTSRLVWNSLKYGTEGRWGNQGTWNPTVIKGAFHGTAQDSWQYREEHGVKSFLLDDDTCDCKSTLNAGHAMCGGSWNQTYAQPAGAEYRYGVDTLNDGGCLGPLPTRKLEMFYREKIDTSGLSLWLDATDSESYGGGTEWLDTSGNGIVFESREIQTPLVDKGGVQALGFNGSGYWRSTSGHELVNMSGEYTLLFWVWSDDLVTRRTIFEKESTGYASYQQEIAVTWEPSETFSWYSQHPDYGYGGTPPMSPGSWALIGIRMSDGERYEARRGYSSLNGSAWGAAYTSRSVNPVKPAGAIRIGNGYAGTVENGAIARVMAWNREISDAEINAIFQAQRAQFGV